MGIHLLPASSNGKSRSPFNSFTPKSPTKQTQQNYSPPDVHNLNPLNPTEPMITRVRQKATQAKINVLCTLEALIDNIVYPAAAVQAVHNTILC